MKGEQHLRDRADYERVQKCGRWVRGDLVRIKRFPNDKGISRYGFIVSKKVGRAVTRNLIKRRLREIVRQQDIVAGLDIIVCANPQASTASFTVLRTDVIQLLGRSSLLRVGC